MAKKKDRAEELRDQARAELRPGQSIELLQELHVLTREGHLNADSRRKLKQVYHLVQLLEPWVQEAAQSGVDPVLVDVGAGKSYLGFLLYDLLLKPLGKGWVWGVEARPELVEKSRALAARLGFERMRFVEGKASEAAALPRAPTVVMALHACDTATDEALDLALSLEARHVAVVPCCQAELARVLKPEQSLPELRELFRQPLHRREYGSHLTNVLRCLRLQASGYHVNVTELVGWEHSLKNELIRADLKGAPLKENADRLQGALVAHGLESLSRRFQPKSYQ